MLGVGIELGASAVRAVVLERTGQGAAAALTLRSATELPCDTANPDVLTQTLMQLRRALRLTEPVVLGLPSTTAILATVHPLIVTPARAHLAVQFELQQRVPFDVADTAWHYRWLSPGAPRPASDGAVVAVMRRSLLESRLAACRRAGLAVRAVAVNPVAILNAVRHTAAGASSAAAAVLNLQSDAMAEWIVWSRTQLDVAPATSPAPALAGAGHVEVSSRETTEELSASWEALRQQAPDLPGTVWVVGPESAMASLQEGVAARHHLEIKRADVWQGIAQTTVRAEAPERWAAAVGLALQALGRGALSLNLIAEAQDAVWSTRVRTASLAAVGMCALAAVVFGVSGMLEVRSRRAHVLKLLERQERLYQSLRPDVQALLRRQQRLQAHSRQLEELIADRAILAHVLAQVSGVLPDSVWLIKADLYKEDGIRGILEGRARSFQDVTHFLDQLKNAAGMTSVKPLATSVMMDEATKKEVVTFSVHIERTPPAAEAVSEKEPVKPSKGKKP